MKQLNIIAILALLLLIACSDNGPMTPADFVRWSSDPSNGLVLYKDFDDLRFQLKYRPLEEVVLSSRPITDSVNFNKSVNSKKGALHFTLKLESLKSKQLLEHGLTSAEQYPARLYYYTTQLHNDISLIVGSDTVPAALAHFERNYGAAAFNTISISFVPEYDVSNKDLKVLFNDRVFGQGRQEFIIKSKDRAAVPKIRFS